MKTNLLRIALILLFAIGFNLATGPAYSSIGGYISMLALLFFSISVSRENLRWLSTWSVLFIVIFNIGSFYWLETGFENIAGIGFGSAFALLVVSSIIIQFKILVFIMIFKVMYHRWNWSILPSLIFACMISDTGFNFIFPWQWGSLISGNAWNRQFVGFFGVSGLSFVIALKTWLFYEVIIFLKYKFFRKNSKTKTAPYPGVPKTALYGTLIVLILIYAICISTYYKKENYERTLSVGIVQTNIKPGFAKLKGDDAYVGNALNASVNLSLESIIKAHGKLDLLVLPESVVPFYTTLQYDPDSGEKSRNFSPTFYNSVRWLSAYGGTNIIYNELIQKDEQSYFNAISTFEFETRKRGESYYKQKLLPFGEYIPMEKQFPFLRKLFTETSRYIPGSNLNYLEIQTASLKNSFYPRPPQEVLGLLEKPEQLDLNWPTSSTQPTQKTTILPLVCYEGMFAWITNHFLESNSQQLPDLIVNLSNDAWFESILEKYQHASLARIRAVEMRRYMIRSNLSGISTVYNSKGNRVSAELDNDVAGVLNVNIPILTDPHTWYVWWGDWPLTGIYVAFVAFLFWKKRTEP